MKVWNKVQFAIIIAFLVLGAFVFVSPYFIKKSGVVVVSVLNPSCQNVHVGDTLTEVGGNQINDIQDFNSARFQSNQFVPLVVSAGPGGCTALSDGSIGIEAKAVSTSSIIYGVDLVGGTKYKIGINSIPSNQLENISHVLNARTSYLNLADVKVQNLNNQLEIIAGNDANIDQLLFQGYLEGGIDELISLKNNSANLQIGTNNYTITEIGNSFLINNSTYSLNDSFYLNDVRTAIVNKTNTSIVISLTIFNNSDVLGEVPGYSQVSFDSNSGKYNFNVLVRLSAEASKRFSDIIQNVKTTVVGSQVSLDAVLVFKLDGMELSRLGMPVNLKGQQITTLYVVGSDTSKDSLLNKKNMVDASINAGALPQTLFVSGRENFDATEKNNVLPLLGVIVFSIAIVPIFFGVKYKKFGHNSFSILIGAAEIFSVVSLFIALQVFYKLNFALDFAALLGISFISLNWMVNVISLNISTHSQKNLILKFKYKKIISLTGLTKVLLVLTALVFGAYGYASGSAIIIIGVLLDYIIFRPFYKTFVV